MSRPVKYDNRRVYLPNASTIGYGRYYAKAGNLIVFQDEYREGLNHLTHVGKVIGRISETDTLQGERHGQWVGHLLVLQCAAHLMYGYERWIDPATVTQCCEPEHAAHFMAWLFKAEPAELFKYTRDDLSTRQAADYSSVKPCAKCGDPKHAAFMCPKNER